MNPRSLARRFPGVASLPPGYRRTLERPFLRVFRQV